MTLQELAKSTPRKKRGPAPKPLSERKFTLSKPVTRVERSYSKQKRRDVLMFLIHHKVYEPGPLAGPDGWRRPKYKEAAARFQIPTSTLGSWYTHRHKFDIWSRVSIHRCPDLDEQVFTTRGSRSYTCKGRLRYCTNCRSHRDHHRDELIVLSQSTNELKDLLSASPK